MDTISLLLPAIFGVALIIAVALYLIGGKAQPKVRSSDSRKTESYACGEVLPVRELRVDLERFVVFAVYFLIFDVMAFMLATSFFDLGLTPILYSLVVLAAVVMLIVGRRHL